MGYREREKQMADENADVQAEITPEAFDGEQDTKQADSSPAEETKPEAVDKPEDTKADDTADDTQATDTDSDQQDADETETEPQDKPLKPKSENRFQNLANENRALKEEVERLTGEVYQPKTADDFQAEGLTAAEARVAALESRLEIKEFTEQVSQAQSAIGGDSMQVLNDFPWANPDSEEFDEDLHGQAAELLEANLIRHPQIPEIGPDGQPTGLGIVIGSNVPPYQLYQTLDRARGISSTKGRIQGQQAAERQLANADTASAAAPAKTKADPLDALWEDEL